VTAKLVRALVRPGTHVRSALLRTVVDPRTIPGALAASGLEAPWPDAAPAPLLRAFVRAVEVGCLGPVAPGLTLEIKPIRETEFPSGEVETVQSVALPPLTEGALAVLENMLCASVPLGGGLTRATIEEDQVKDESTLDIATLPPVTPPFRTLFPEPQFARDLRLLVALRRPLDSAAEEAIVERLTAWAKLCVGGFPAPEVGGLSMMKLDDVSPHVDDLLTGQIGIFAGSPAAWDALARLGVTLHRDVAPLEAIEIT